MLTDDEKNVITFFFSISRIVYTQQKQKTVFFYTNIKIKTLRNVYFIT